MASDRPETTFHHHATFSVGTERGPSPGRILAGIAVILVGLGLLLDRLNVLPFGDLVGTWWPLAIIGVGLTQFLNRSNKGWFMPTAITAAGVVLQAMQLDMLPGSFFYIFWPILLILFGVSLLLGRGQKKNAVPEWANGSSGVDADNVIQHSAIFSGLELHSTASAFTGGSLAAIFGGIELDLRNAKAAGTSVTLAATAIFGGIEVMVPPTWRVITTGTPIFGGVENKTIHVVAPGQSGPVVTIETTIVFGGIEIHH